jgi:hypothetical protein
MRPRLGAELAWAGSVAVSIGHVAAHDIASRATAAVRHWPPRHYASARVSLGEPYPRRGGNEGQRTLRSPGGGARG